MKKILSLIIIGILCVSTFSIFLPQVKASLEPSSPPLKGERSAFLPAGRSAKATSSLAEMSSSYESSVGIHASSLSATELETEIWPTFHQNNRRTGYSPSRAPHTNQTLWAFKTQDWIEYTSPTVANGKVFSGSDDGYLYCLGENDGALIWSFDTRVDAPTSWVWSEPTVSNGKVFVGSYDLNGYVYCLSESNGAVVWKYQIGQWGITNGFAVDGDRAVVGVAGETEAYVYCFNATTGEVLWKFATGIAEGWGGSWGSTPAIDNNRVFLGQYDGFVYCLDLISGSLIWKSIDTLGSVDSSPAISNGRVFISNYCGYVFCFNETNGDLIWKMVPPGWNWWSSCAVANGKVFVGTGQPNRLYCLDEITGEVIWEEQLGPSNSWIVSSPAISGDGKVFVGSEDGNIYCVDEVTGDVIWKYQTGDMVLCSPAVANGKVFVGSADGYLYAFGSPEAPDFEVSVSTGYQIINLGESVSFEISLTPLNGFDFEVSFFSAWIATPSPAETPLSGFSPWYLTPPGISVLTITTFSSTSQGEYVLEIIAISGSITHSETVVFDIGVLIPEVPQIQQETCGSCWAAASEMVLEYYRIYGPEISQIQIARELGHEEYYRDGLGDWSGMESALEALGKLDVSYSYSLSFDDIVNDVGLAKPIMASYQESPTEGHVVVIVGYIDDLGTSNDGIIINDPRFGGQKSVLWSDFEEDLLRAVRTHAQVEKSSISIHFTELETCGFRRYSASSSTSSFWWFTLRKWDSGWELIPDAPDQLVRGDWSANINIAGNGQGNYRLHLTTSTGIATTWDVNIEWVTRALEIRAESPVNIMVIDPTGSRVGHDLETGQVVNEIPAASYSGSGSEPQLIVIPNPVDGHYAILSMGTGTGTYSLATMLMAPDGDVVHTCVGEAVEGAVYVYRVSIADEMMTTNPDPAAELEHFKEFINGLPDVAFDKPKLASQRKNTLFNKIDEVIWKVGDGNYTDAVNKLLHDIRAKTDGNSTPRDWIVDADAPSSLCVIIDHIISSIETLQQE